MMIKSKFYKNLYQTISYCSVVLIFVFFLLIGYIESLNYPDSKSWVLLVASIAMIILFLLVGFPWIFQTVEFSSTGIKISLFGKEKQHIEWDQVEEITRTNVLRNPAYVIKIKGAKKINIDSRKKIKNAILHFGSKHIKEQLLKIK